MTWVAHHDMGGTQCQALQLCETLLLRLDAGDGNWPFLSSDLNRERKLQPPRGWQQASQLLQSFTAGSLIRPEPHSTSQSHHMPDLDAVTTMLKTCGLWQPASGDTQCWHNMPRRDG